MRELSRIAFVATFLMSLQLLSAVCSKPERRTSVSYILPSATKLSD